MDTMFMNLTYNQFTLLVFLERSECKVYTQRELSSAIGISLGLVNRVLNELIEAQLIVLDSVGFYAVSKNKCSLEPYKVKGALIFAAGFGERLMPLTQKKHKSLLTVKDKPIITYILDALVAAGIDDITIVRGYLKEQFEFLKNDYPNIVFVDNPIYATSKNITSAFLVRDKFAQSYIIEGDVLLKNPLVIKKYEYHTHFKTIHVERSEMWCFKLLGSKIKEYKLGGENVHETSGVSFWSQNDAENFSLISKVHLICLVVRKDFGMMFL